MSTTERARRETGYVRGLRTALTMLETMGDVDECVVGGGYVRDGRPQDNAVRRTFGAVLMRGDAAELDGFCAALTEALASADENGDAQCVLARYIARREAVMRRRRIGRRQQRA